MTGFGASSGRRDVALLGSCDDGCRALAAALGWAADLDDLHTRITTRREHCQPSSTDDAAPEAHAPS